MTGSDLEPISASAEKNRIVVPVSFVLPHGFMCGRQVLREVLEAPLQFTPEGKTYRFDGPIAVGQLLDGVVPPTSGGIRAGLEPATFGL